MAVQTTDSMNDSDKPDTDPKDLDNRQGSADVSADDERKKFIAQNGENPLAQERAQDVPQPQSDEVKRLQDEMAEAEHQAKGASADDPEEAEGEKEGRLNAAANREGLDLKTIQKQAVAKAHADNKS
jgi:hypothetical protein